uniref:Eukaryotic translation initiation factor 3 subunit I n=1 Tax=Homo sapiens TaxID=9606 RepID=A0A7I2YQI6_HUMAN
MKPILLQGHERSITQIKYNREGDLLFTVAKDPIVNVWYSVNGERLGTYMGHTGAVWCVDADWDTKHVLTGSADNSCRLWDCETGKQLALLKTNSAVRTCGFDFGGNIIMFSTDKQMGYQCFVSFFDLRDPSQIDNNEPYMKIPCNDSKITSAVWGPLGECIIAGHESGELNQYSAKSGEVLVNVKEHSRQINDIQLSRDMTMFVTASKDNTAKLFDSTTLEHQKTFRTERPVNSAALSPNYDHVVLGGGQEAMDVTTTSTRIGKFEARGRCQKRRHRRAQTAPTVALPQTPMTVGTGSPAATRSPGRGESQRQPSSRLSQLSMLCSESPQASTRRMKLSCRGRPLGGGSLVIFSSSSPCQVQPGSKCSRPMRETQNPVKSPSDKRDTEPFRESSLTAHTTHRGVPNL